MSALGVPAGFEPETDPDRRGAQVLLACAWSLWPDAGMDELVDWALLMAGRDAPVGRELFEAVGLDMLLERGGA